MAKKKEEKKNVAESAEDIANAQDYEVEFDDLQDRIDDLEDELHSKNEECQEWKDKYVRLHAEWDTYRRRAREQQDVDKARAVEGFAEDMIPVIDDFERSIDYARENGEDGLLGGVEAILSKIMDVFAKHSVETISPEGEEYNALEAQAVSTVEDPDVEDETVLEVYQKGYKIANKVLRPATVVVSTGGPKREKPEEDVEADEEREENED